MLAEMHFTQWFGVAVGCSRGVGREAAASSDRAYTEAAVMPLP